MVPSPAPSPPASRTPDEQDAAALAPGPEDVSGPASHRARRGRGRGAATRPLLHMIGNAHLDAAWLWQWPEAFQAAKATFRSALDRMREYPEFVFTASSAAFHEWIERSDPAMFEEIRARVAQGRWHLAGGWWVEADCNIPSGESLVRQGLVGQRWFVSRFGRMATVGHNPDAFGHAGSLPQILRGQGMDAYVFLRPQPHERELPDGPFWWESPDGSRVLALRIPFEYCSPRNELDAQLAEVLGRLGEGWDEHVMFYGVGNHGGGPTRANLDSIRRLDAEATGPRLACSTIDAFLEPLRSDGQGLPVVRGELQHHSVGCYSAHSRIKLLNSRAETALVTAETLAAVAERLTGQPYPAADLARAWRSVLFNQFHDIIAGTCIEPACDDAIDQYGEALAVAARVRNDAVQSIAWGIEIPLRPETTPIVVVNPHPWRVDAPVELEFGRLARDARLVDDEGRAVALQRLQSRAAVTPGHSRSRLAFVAGLPALGWRVFHVVPGPSGSILPGAVPGPADVPGMPDPPVPAQPHVRVTNGILELAVDRASGTLTSLRDLRTGVEHVATPRPGTAAGFCAGVVYADESDTWSHGVEAYDRPIGAFAPTRVEVTEHGPVRTVVRVEAAYRSSRLRQDLVLWTGRDRLEVEVTVDWHERDRLLKLRFPTALEAPRATFETPYGTAERPRRGHEEPGQRWVDLSGTVRGPGPGAAGQARVPAPAPPNGTGTRPAGLALLCEGKHGYDVMGADIGLTVLRSPVYAHHDPYVPDASLDWRHQDQGEQQFRYALVPHAGSLATARLARRAAELQQPPIPLAETFHDGPLPREGSFARVEPGNVAVGALKRAEDGDGIVVRAWETAGIDADDATIDLPLLGRTIACAFRPGQVRTFLVPDDLARPVVEVDLLEQPRAPRDD